MTIRVVVPGAFTTVQDLGRSGFAWAGVPPSGAMDVAALRVGNLLVGDDEESAALEITLHGPTLHFEEDAVVALTGAEIEADLDGTPVTTLESFRITSGSTLRLRQCTRGVRAYLAVRGGIDVPSILGSRSTLASAGFGGLYGRALKQGDVLAVRAVAGDGPLRRTRTPSAPPDGAVRVLRGPQLEAFTDAARAAFFAQEFHVSPRSDRVGVRLEGELIEHVEHADIDPEGVVTGAIQVPGDGHPIILGPDRPVTGGYAKIATVIAADLGMVAQARPGDSLRFVEISLDDARAAWRDRERALADGIEDLA
jgi:antagonist of KipI